jgi:hypothetical protein
MTVTYTGRHEHRKNKADNTAMPQLGFKPSIPVFQTAKKFLALHSAITVIGCYQRYMIYSGYVTV